MAAGIADVEVPAEGGRPAGDDVPKDLPLIRCEDAGLPVGRAMAAEDVRHLGARPSDGGLRPWVTGMSHGMSVPGGVLFFGEEVEGALHSLDVPGGHVGVAGGGSDRGVAKESLDHTDVGAELEEMGREAVTVIPRAG